MAVDLVVVVNPSQIVNLHCQLLQLLLLRWQLVWLVLLWLVPLRLLLRLLNYSLHLLSLVLSRTFRSQCPRDWIPILMVIPTLEPYEGAYTSQFLKARLDAWHGRVSTKKPYMPTLRKITRY
jgi:hypothetical protein